MVGEQCVNSAIEIWWRWWRDGASASDVFRAYKFVHKIARISTFPTCKCVTLKMSTAIFIGICTESGTLTDNVDACCDYRTVTYHLWGYLVYDIFKTLFFEMTKSR